MRKYAALRERLAAWESSLRGRVILTAVVVILGGACAWPLVAESFSYERLCREIEAVLIDANAAQRTPVAVELLEKGTVTLGPRTVGSARVKAMAPQFFDESGGMSEARAVASVIAATLAPTWAPPSILERPWLVTGIATGVGLLVVTAVWAGLFLPMVLIVAACGGVMAPLWMLGLLDPMVAVGAIGALLFSFLLLTRLALRLLAFPFPAAAVAHTLLLEGLRQRISLGFLGALLVILPLIPLTIDAREPLRYQVQTYLSKGTTLLFVFAACLTLFLSCATVSFEIRDRQIWTLLTKPLSRIQYLLGKFAGLIILNAIILLVGGAAVLLHTEFLRTRPAVDIADAAALQDQVLVARAVAIPDYESIDPLVLQDSVNRAVEQDSVLRADIAEGRRSESEVRRDLTDDKVKAFDVQQRTIDAGKARTFVFHGLSEARAAGSDPVLRYKFHIGRDDSHETFPVLFIFADAPPALVNYVPVQRNVFPIPVAAIAEDGTLSVQVVNGGLTNDLQFYPGPWSMNFDRDGFEVLHRVGSFEGNFGRALLVDWSKLVFIAALGVAAGSILSFPVAVLLAFTVFISGSLSPFLGMALSNYYIRDESDFATRAFQHAVKAIAEIVRWAFAPFSQSGATTDLVDGQAISWMDVFSTFWKVALAWSAVALSVGFLAFRRKEIAIYSGHG
ncbi:MAG: hypothetical protein EXS03_01260 [Phycisphaerales bacterium]|nr:hypothetical protein [Phycisphaerales bacterium]